jgi:type II secretory pathway pseudopilin PulG
MSITRSQRGFIMALALAVAVVMGLMLMKAGPNIIKEVQRENESELIFRGEAIAAAIKIYSAKTGRFPTSLDDVMKVRPRILRQKYLDPMTAEGDWDYVTQVQPGASGNKEGLPIVGVRSKSNANGIHTYQNKENPRDWLFSADQNLLGVTDELGKARGLPKAGNNAEKPAAPKE